MMGIKMLCVMRHANDEQKTKRMKNEKKEGSHQDGGIFLYIFHLIRHELCMSPCSLHFQVFCSSSSYLLYFYCQLLSYNSCISIELVLVLLVPCCHRDFMSRVPSFSLVFIMISIHHMRSTEFHRTRSSVRELRGT